VAETRNQRIGLVIVVVLGLLAIILIVPFIVGQSQNVVSYKTMKDFEGYKQSTIQRLSSHLEAHPKCIYRDAIPIIESAETAFAERPKKIKAWVNQKKEALKPMIWFNSRLQWNEEDAYSAITHEVLHLMKTVDGEFLCGPDRYIRKVGDSKIPVCRPFGEEVYDSEQLTKAIASHFAKYSLARKD
jgi:hypothetical protein